MSEVAVGVDPGTRHPTALIDPAAEVAASASVGPYTIIGPGVRLEEGVQVASHVLIERDTRVGRDARIHHGAVLGTDPQDMKYGGESSTLAIGSRTTIREYATLNRGTAASGVTRVGDDCLVMAYAHVAHDCHLGDHVILANTVNMGGHVEIGDWAIVGGVTAIHQFVRIGRHAFVGGGSRIPQDVAPYVTVAGSPAAAYGINTEGLRRRDFDEATVRELRRAYRTLFRSELNLGDAVRCLEEEGEPIPEVREMIEFIRASERGVTS
ncbi:MAG TPA: acyl-ACP--UDP-N-acetylglucosamine O-acyltransferase [Gemmatimonadota bacterium]|nr:acyl-ACP--UDP-N-acetylglucosamine O-acyltransferase [Gemmatimonadota bacterium]